MIRANTTAWAIVAGVIALTSAPARENWDGDGSIRIEGELKQWHKVTLTFDGPFAAEANPEINPFTDFRLSAEFAHEGGTSRRTVPGYFAADGNAAETSATEGTKWRVHFSPDLPGKWSYTLSMVAGEGAALGDSGEALRPYNGRTGTFTIAPTDKTGSDFRAKGLLRHVGKHHLRFAGTGEYFLKGGADSPENFLGYAEFDSTRDADAGSGSYEHIGTFIHHYKPHLRDWQEGDPTWKNGKGKGMIGALNYLASKGMNSVYFLTYNLDGGDGRDTWMWTGPDVRDRFDCSKLDQWEIVFSHMDRMGIMLHVVTQETENDRKLGGSAGLNPIRKLYYRELAARFSHHLALTWNVGEENNTPDKDRKEIAKYTRDLDPYDHPITVHTHNNKAMTFYDGILGDPSFEATSIQGRMENYNRDAIALRRRSAEAGRKWAIFGDEQPPASHGILPDETDPTHDKPRKHALWGNLMGGGSGVEWYFGHQFPHMDINCEDWRSRENMWNQTRHALRFFHQHLPFWEMEPSNELADGKNALVLAKPGETYAVYLPNGETAQLDLQNYQGEFQVRWYNPRSGGPLKKGTVTTITGPGVKNLGAPPEHQTKDWAVLVTR